LNKPTRTRSTLSDQERSLPRRLPTQRRSRERVERMLSVATTLISEKGIDAVKMSEIASLADVSIGSLYQYFPEKAALVRTLAERYNAEGRACVEAELGTVNVDAALEPTLHRIVDGYYEMFMQLPAMRDIWRATQADKALQEMDEADCEHHAMMLYRVLINLRPNADQTELKTLASLVMQQIAAVVRHAITLERTEGDATIEMFKKMFIANVFEVLEF
jgi:AcrR family transcriptional regulator